jgi:hypothetical protein
MKRLLSFFLLLATAACVESPPPPVATSRRRHPRRNRRPRALFSSIGTAPPWVRAQARSSSWRPMRIGQESRARPSDRLHRHIGLLSLQRAAARAASPCRSRDPRTGRACRPASWW